MGPPARLTFLGHATVAVDLGGGVLLTDPLLRRRVAFLRWTAPVPRLEALPDIDAVLISHLHPDHCDPASLALLGRHRRLVVPAGTEAFFRRRGFHEIVPLQVGERCTVGSVEVTAAPAEHDGRRLPLGPGRGQAIGYLIRGGGVRVYFAGDTDLFPGMRDLGDRLDVALLPVAGWGRTLGPGHLDPVRAAEATQRLRPAVAVPIHWGSLRPLWQRTAAVQQSAAPASAFAVEVRRRRLPTEVVVLQAGEALTWPC